MRTVVAGWIVLMARAVASDPPSGTDPNDLDFFETRVRPVLAEHCYSCHGDADQKAGLRLDHIESILEGGDSGPAIVPGRPSESRMLHAVAYDDVELQMPPRGKLSAAAIADLSKWIELGAPWPVEARSAGTKKKDGPIDVAARKAEHWCWRPLAPVTPPETGDPTVSPIDAFVRDRLARESGSQSAEADRATLLRRVSFDLIGLPPTAEEIDAFVTDPAPDAYERRVDALLASPRFGERWARHWMDLFRYAESYGHEFDYPIEEAWRYRDYLIRALNEDVPYDQLVREHLAGDLLDPPRVDPTTGTNESIQATAHFYFHQATHGPVDPRQDEADRIDNQIDVLTKSFLALGVSCARCHDHKFDAISTRDYYALSGYLKSSRRRIARLDPGGAIAQSALEAKDLVSRVESRIAELTGAGALARWRESERLAAAAAALPAEAGEVTIAAEDLRVVAVPRGEFRAQDMGGFGADRWRGNSQMWWTGGQPGDRLVLEFDSAHAGAARVEASFTKARDYATIRAFVDGSPAATEFDAYDRNVTPSGFLTLFEGELCGGPHQVAFEIVGKNEHAVAGYMVGIDDLRIVPLAPDRDRAAAVAAVAERHGVEADRLLRFTKAEFARASRTGDPSKPARPVATFEDFESDFGNWKEAGFAFAGSPRHGAADSSVLGRRFEGTLRSRSFVIESDWILYRLAGERSRIRTIVDSYQLDVFNALLFEGFTFDVSSPGGYTWRAQRVGKYRGHRAHIELLDEGDGWLAVDTIAFADSPDLVRSEPDARSAIGPIESDAVARDALLADGRWLALDDRIADFEARLAAIDSRIVATPRVLAIEDGFGEDDYVHVRGKPTNHGDSQPRRFLEALGGGAVAATGTGSGRLALAEEWLAPSNPLPSRVAVNRIWHHLFGRGIVPTTDDFGVLGEEPSHPELLDWLASWFRLEAKWSQKALIRSIVLSRTYRAQSEPSDEVAERLDPQNRWLHRRNVRRLEGEVIRDAMLSISGSLDLQMYGPSVPVHLTPFMDGRGRPGSSGPLDGGNRRSVYLEVRRNFLSPFMLAFDTPLPSSTVGRRSVSNVPAQGLILMNDPLVVELSRRTAARHAPEGAGPVESVVDSLHRAVLGRSPSEEERAALVEFARSQFETYRALDPTAARERTAADLCQVLFNSKEFYFLR